MIYKVDIRTECEFTFNGVEGEFSLMFNFIYHEGRPAFISGLPENCYPEDPPEWEFENIQILNVIDQWIDLPDQYHETVNDALVNAMQEQIEILKQEGDF
ncbi:MAG: hypothetical protein DRQ39_05315 [Gammaproteobacteria bacterium]|nr:MAG: hypothetical protein DRQ39_05315 [Gammaproteobacteria bacterium]